MHIIYSQLKNISLSEFFCHSDDCGYGYGCGSGYIYGDGYGDGDCYGDHFGDANEVMDLTHFVFVTK